MRTWIKNPLAILTTEELVAEGGLVVDGSVIVETLVKGEKPQTPVDLQFDASEHVVLPGLVNTHHHFYQTLTRSFPGALNKSLFSWLKSLYPVWAGLDTELIDVSTRLAAAELLLSGCTTAVDHHYIYPKLASNALDIQVNALKDSGIRAVLTRGSMSLGEDHGGLPPQNTVQDEDVILSDCERVISTHHDSSWGSYTQIALAPCSPFSVSEQLMIDSGDIARRHKVRLHTHLAETHDETEFCINMFGVRPVDYLERVGWLGADTWLAHGIHFNDDEVARLGAVGVGITHCPGSNMVLASGICRTLELEAAGCHVGLGVDGSASNDGSNLIQEVRQALLLQKLFYGADKVTHFDALRWATHGSAKCIGRDDIGKIEVGRCADLALFKLDEPRFSGVGDALAALLLCGAYKADYVMVAGVWQVEGGVINDLDINALMVEHAVAAKKLVKTV